VPRRRLSIVQVTTFYPPDNFGGDGVHVQRLSEALARRGHDVRVVYTPAAYSLLRARGWPGRQVGSDLERPDGSAVLVEPLTGPGAALETMLVQQFGAPVLSRRRLRRLLAGHDGTPPDVIHYHNVSLAGGLGVLGLGRAVKLYTAHEYWLVCPTHLLFRYGREICDRRTCVRCTLRSGRPPQFWRYLRRRDRHLAAIDSIVFPSRATQAVYEAQGITRPGRVLPHFLQDEYFDRAGAAGARDRSAEPYFLYVGRLDAVKGIAHLLAHFAARPALPLLRIAGDGPLGPGLRAEYARQPGIEFLGTCRQDELSPLYRDAIALILPSVGYEIFGQVVLEAIAHGTPAVVSATCGAAGMVAAAGAGFAYQTSAELDEALHRLAGDTALRDELGSRGREYARREHREDAYIDRYEALVTELGA